MTDTAIPRPEPASAYKRVTWWWSTTPMRTGAITATVWLLAGAAKELGARLIEWLC